MPSYCQEMIKRYAEHLLPEQIKQIAEEVEDGLRIEISNPGYMGMDCDVSGWVHFADDIRDVYKERVEKK